MNYANVQNLKNSQNQAPYYFADKYCKYFRLADDEFEHFYDVNSFDPTTDFWIY